MTEPTTQITLIGTRLATIGMEFIFRGPTPECETCKLRNTCMNLENNRRYRVLGIRGELVHDCPIHEEGVRAVEITESPIIAAMDARKSFAGSKMVFDGSECDDRGCSMFELCHPAGLREGDRCTIVEVVGEAPEECPRGYSLKLVELKR
ncbi:MAG: hypothetical protein A4E45_01900 [Methanosaeta sp. PtaB.Bin039]|nr:MAG: hypothetical protein A4E45_01900 [Methanosaeta sp. PtaB.Bin039]OPY45125.1 MAG: hypothetical protein A4E47_01113 [Methanosaeta sp. PtaU1.Bin028]HOT07036.1 UPF0179 family protein [Methanotrichaceae archaeon]HQF16036.1 UPF0179 family protein [Methanotrichaceae archaeon]HQI90848.1 UPF0179 family protein [Methanotrichaceae archaeon]